MPVPFAHPDAISETDPQLLGDVDQSCLVVDRLMLQIEASLDAALVMLAGSPEKQARQQIAAARLVAGELRQELGELGLSLLELRDAINGEASS